VPSKGTRNTEEHFSGVTYTDATLGVMIDRMVRGGNTLYALWEDPLLHIWGTRTVKTTTQTAYSIIEAPGPLSRRRQAQPHPFDSRHSRRER
jgi:hypothetical protein